MTKQISSVPTETSQSEILNENSPVDISDRVVADIAVEDDTVIPQEEVPVKKKVASRKKAAISEPKAKKPVTKRTSRTKIDNAESTPPAPVMKAFWGVFNPMMVQVAQYNYADEDQAKKAAADMTEKKKAPHFVQLIKKVI